MLEPNVYTGWAGVGTMVGLTGAVDGSIPLVVVACWIVAAVEYERRYGRVEP